MNVTMAPPRSSTWVLNNIIPLKDPPTARIPYLVIDTGILFQSSVQAAVAARQQHAGIIHFIHKSFFNETRSLNRTVSQ